MCTTQRLLWLTLNIPAVSVRFTLPDIGISESVCQLFHETANIKLPTFSDSITLSIDKTRSFFYWL